MHQSVDDGDDADRIRKHLTPFGKRTVGGDDGRLEFITAIDDVEQQIGVAASVREISDLINDQQVRMSRGRSRDQST